MRTPCEHAPRSIVGGIIVLALFCAAVFGQVKTATVTGTVTDPSGGAIPSATIQVKNESTGAGGTTATNAEGRFSLPYLPIGLYTATVTATGLQGVARNGVPLTAGQVLDLEFKLAVGNTQQEITIHAAYSYRRRTVKYVSFLEDWIKRGGTAGVF